MRFVGRVAAWLAVLCATIATGACRISLPQAAPPQKITPPAATAESNADAAAATLATVHQAVEALDDATAQAAVAKIDALAASATGAAQTDGSLAALQSAADAQVDARNADLEYQEGWSGQLSGVPDDTRLLVRNAYRRVACDDTNNLLGVAKEVAPNWQLAAEVTLYLRERVDAQTLAEAVPVVRHDLDVLTALSPGQSIDREVLKYLAGNVFCPSAVAGIAPSASGWGVVVVDAGTRVVATAGGGRQVGTLPGWSVVPVGCATEGRRITGPAGTGTLWDRTGGGYVPDVDLYRGPIEPARC